MIGARVTLSGNSGLAPVRKRVTDTRALLQVAGRAGRNTMARHLRERNRSHPNQLGGKRTNYWAKAAEATSFHLVENSGQGAAVEISSNQIGLALRYHGTGYLPGGVLRPISGIYLTKPAAPEAHGKRAREFADLEFGFAFDVELGRMRPALVRKGSALSATPKRRGQGAGRPVALPLGPGTVENTGEPIFWLVRQVRQKGDETVLPPEGQIAEEAIEAVDEYVGIVIERGSGAA